MKLAIFSHKPCWRSMGSPSGFATNGGFPFQVKALSELFDETRLLVPIKVQAGNGGEMPLGGHNVKVVPLTGRVGAGFTSKLSFLPWLLRNATTIRRELHSADAVHAPIPGDVGTVGMLLTWLFGKPLFVRHCGNWQEAATMAETFWRWFMETTAGGRNVMFATGGSAEPPSLKNANIKWIFSSSLTRQELRANGTPKAFPDHGQIKLIIAARQEKAKGTGKVIQSLPSLARDFPQITFDVLGSGTAIPEFKRLASELKVEDRVTFAGQLDHNQVLARLNSATVFVFPTTSSDGFPKAVLEGLATALPVVATRVSVLPQLLASGCGVLIDEATPEAIALGIHQVLSDPVRYQAMSRKAIDTARGHSLEAWRDVIGASLSSAWGLLRSGDNHTSR